VDDHITAVLNTVVENGSTHVYQAVSLSFVR